MRIFLLSALVVIAAVSPALSATRTPCSGKKGGIDHCDGTKFVCKDGSTSASKKICEPSKITPADAAKKS